MLRCCASLVLTALLAAPALAQPEPAPPEMLLDAELTAVAFFDADRGWAVGDRGVIWHTFDGGRNWQQQRSGVACRLEAVQFLDANNGWIVGGWTQPYTHETHGVVLRTRDGGRTWQNMSELLLPGLKHVKMFDAQSGWALGDGSPLFPAGVFRTDDGGRSWSPVPKGETLGWVTGDFRDVRTGAVAGHGGTLGLVTGNEIRPTRTPNLGPRYLQRMLLSGSTGGWLVGDGGLVLTTGDGGFTWTAPQGALPDAAVSDFDFRALAVHGSHVWIAGAPGTCVLHSADGGQSWQLHRTGQTAPLRGLWFFDEHRGWAVGALGTILHTRDGGQSWRVQKSGGTRAAILGVFSEPGRVPLELLAVQAGSEGYLTAVEIIGRHDEEPGSSRPQDRTAPSRTHAAIVSAGGTQADTAWQFPLREPGLSLSIQTVLDRWNAANDGQAASQLTEHLVRRIRQWRPDVIVTEDVSPRGDDPLAHLTNQITLAAVAQAADPTAYSDQITLGGLAAWKVKKVFATLGRDKQGLVNITPSQWSPRLARSFADQAEQARGLIVRDVVLSPRTLGFGLLLDHLPQDSGKRDVMSGIALQAGGEARRLLSNPPAGNLEQLARIAQKRHNVEQLLARIESDATLGAGWLGQVSDLTKGLSQRHAGDILWQLGRRYHQVGKSEQAAEALQLLVDKHPQHPLADAAALWLVQYYASSEVAWRQRKETRFEVRVATATSADEERETAGETEAKSPQAGPATSGVRALGNAAPTMTPSERAERAIAVARQIEQSRPTRYADPALRFSLASAARQAGQPRTADKLFQNLAATASQNIWSLNAQAEHWLGRPHADGPKKVCSAVTALHKPKLDGRLDDPLWRSAKPVALVSPHVEASEYPAQAVLAFDEAFLYFAVSCRRVPGLDYQPDSRPRVPDAELHDRDHVQLLLDVDRDYASYWSLAFDHRGWPADSCFGDRTWNPEWFLAAGGDADWWTVEAAIPLAELGPKRPQARDVWSVGIQRVIPKLGLQSLATPAAVDPRPEGFALLMFE
jgi:photosystem II stability/assembly factor-like uncharacterized protein/tetratricopeptide (TPR) repeat protein